MAVLINHREWVACSGEADSLLSAQAGCFFREDDMDLVFHMGEEVGWNVIMAYCLGGQVAGACFRIQIAEQILVNVCGRRFVCHVDIKEIALLNKITTVHYVPLEYNYFRLTNTA